MHALAGNSGRGASARPNAVSGTGGTGGGKSAATLNVPADARLNFGIAAQSQTTGRGRGGRVWRPEGAKCSVFTLPCPPSRTAAYYRVCPTGPCVTTPTRRKMPDGPTAGHSIAPWRGLTGIAASCVKRFGHGAESPILTPPSVARRKIETLFRGISECFHQYCSTNYHIVRFQ